MTPSQTKAVEALREQVLPKYGEGYEYKRFETHPFTSNPKLLEVFVEVGKADENPLEAITHRFVTQFWVGERGGVELANQPKGKPIKGLRECVEHVTKP